MKYKIIEGSVQDQFRLGRKKIQLFGGGFGNGKSAASCVKGINLALSYPGSNGLIGRATYAKLNDTVRKEFFKWLPAKYIAKMPTVNENTLYLTNGSVVNFRYIAQRGKKTNDGQTTSNLLSATYDWAIVDQIEDPEILYKDFLDLMGRMRGSTPYKGSDPTMPMTGPRFLMLTTNPTGNWVYSKLVKPYHEYLATGHVGPDLIVDEDTLEPIIEVFEGPTDDNAHNLDADFIKGLKATYKGQMYERFFLGKWASYEGLVYPDFSRDSHMLPHSKIMDILQDRWRERSRYDGIEGFDFGIGVPSCYLLGFTDDQGRVIIVDGFYTPGLTMNGIISRIHDLHEKYEAFIQFREPIWADPAIFNRTQVKGETIHTVAALMSEGGLYVKPGQNSIESGVMKVTGYLALQEAHHMFNDQLPGPNLLFSDDLQFIADEFFGYFWKTNQMGERIDQPNGRNDHAMDTIKYMLSRLPDPSELLFRKPLPTPEMLKWHERA
jgi:hypothetical protein